MDTAVDERRILYPNLILMTCCLSLFMVSVDVTIVNVALPSIQADLHASTADLQWTIDAYTLVVASLLMLMGSTADRFGRRRFFQIGMAGFCAGSILCGLAPTIGWLIVARALQALGGTMLNPVAVAIITNIFVEPKARARAIGVWSSISGIALAAGPLAGGFLTQSFGWRAIFWVNIPFGLLAIVLTALYIPESRAARPRPVDWGGQALVIVTLASLIAAVIEGPRLGWASPATIGLFATFAVGVVLLLAYERRQLAPLIDLNLFRSAPFTSATLIAVLSFASFGAFLFLNAIVLQDVLGYTAFETGLCTLPLAFGNVVLPPLSSRVLSRSGARWPLVCSGAGTAVSALFLSMQDRSTPLGIILVAYALYGVGYGLVNAPITYTAVSGLPRDRAGLAAGIASTSRQIGLALGVALAGTIAGASLADQPGGFPGSIRIVWWIVIGFSVAVSLLGLLSTSAWGQATTRHVAHLFAEEKS